MRARYIKLFIAVLTQTLEFCREELSEQFPE